MTAIISIQPAVYLPQFGGSPGADAATALQAAVNSGAPKIDLQGRPWKVGSTVIIPPGGAGEIINGTLDASTFAMPVSATNFVLKQQGSLGANLALTADVVGGAAFGAQTLTMSPANAATLAPLDLLFVSSNEEWATGLTYVGEYVRVRSISGGVVTLTAPLKYNYTVANAAKAQRQAPSKGLKMRDVDLIGPVPVDYAGTGFAGGILLDSVEGARIDGGSYQNLNNAAIKLEKVGSSYLEDLRILNCPNWYGISLYNGCHEVDITGLRAEEVRHGVSIGGNTGAYGISRNIRVAGAKVTSRSAGLDAHWQADDVIFEGSQVTVSGAESGMDGIVSQAASTRVSDCQINGAVRDGVRYEPALTNAAYAGVVSLQGIDVTSPNPNLAAGSDGGVFVYIRNGAPVPKSLNVANINVVGGFESSVDVTILGNALPGTLDICTITGVTGRGFTKAIARLRVGTAGVNIKNAVVTGLSGVGGGAASALELRAEGGNIDGTVVGQVAASGLAQKVVEVVNGGGTITNTLKGTGAT